MWKRGLYLGYYLKKLDWARFRAYLAFAEQRTHRTRVSLLKDVLASVFQYNISPLDYFYFRFYEKNDEERTTYAGTGHMYEYQLKMNPPTERSVLGNKNEFNHAYRRFVRRITYALEELQSEEARAELLNNPSGKLVLKAATGQVGAEVEVVPCRKFEQVDLRAYMQQKGYDLAEEFVRQHPQINQLSPSGLNTIRIFSQLDEQGQVHCLGARIRISVNSTVDNMAAGNLAAPVDETTGIVNGPAVYSDITKAAVTHHPITKREIMNFQIPYWPDTMAMVEEAARLYSRNRSIGWDVAITAAGPELIEGNHNWCKLLWQLPVGKGLKATLDPFQ